MSKRLSLLAVAAFAVFAAPAFAECDEAQESAAGKAIASATSAAVAKAVAVEGKQMVSINSCEAAGGGAYAEFKYNFLGAGGLYWVEGSARVKGGAVSELKLKRMSPNLADASTKAGVKLASN
ncbi:hypothetical protein PQU92_17585 [Asticcacaulis sp. BYS171W]|uniref:Lipoprotein n=1 Tax=Asticcacaulis aquaticus TaxID=2984212 RepID=A0ABT5HZ43_9CAUL|nr:hypothetical protein [Asticcacaulis aquaticus]MDC7685100.1 hypothetical protein [Asticcacaulis aquaticus]